MARPVFVYRGRITRRSPRHRRIIVRRRRDVYALRLCRVKLSIVSLYYYCLLYYSSLLLPSLFVGVVVFIKKKRISSFGGALYFYMYMYIGRCICFRSAATHCCIEGNTDKAHSRKKGFRVLLPSKISFIHRG